MGLEPRRWAPVLIDRGKPGAIIQRGILMWIVFVAGALAGKALS